MLNCFYIRCRNVEKDKKERKKGAKGISHNKIKWEFMGAKANICSFMSVQMSVYVLKMKGNIFN
jgi:hypothetical protein